MIRIAERIVFARNAASLTQEQAIERMHQIGHQISQGSWSQIERGVNRGKPYRQAIARVLGVRIEWLLYGEDPMRAPSAQAPPLDALRMVRESDDGDRYNVGRLLYEMVGELKGLRGDCHELNMRIARLETAAGAADDHQSITA
jgi:transcriptional regulator with XRE-family HTH domain